MIDEARSAVAVAVNAGLTLLYWRIGKRIDEDVLGHARAGYGDEIVSTLSRQLSWSHFQEIVYLKQPLQKEFYAEMCRLEPSAFRRGHHRDVRALS